MPRMDLSCNMDSLPDESTISGEAWAGCIRTSAAMFAGGLVSDAWAAPILGVVVSGLVSVLTGWLRLKRQREYHRAVLRHQAEERRFRLDVLRLTGQLPPHHATIDTAQPPRLDTNP